MITDENGESLFGDKRVSEWDAVRKNEKRTPLINVNATITEIGKFVDQLKVEVTNGTINEKDADAYINTLRAAISPIYYDTGDETTTGTHAQRPYAGSNQPINISYVQAEKGEGDEAVVSQVGAMIGSRKPVKVPMWNSIYTASFHGVSEVEASALYMRLISNRSEIGALTVGVSLTADDCILNCEILDFMAARLKSSNVAGMNSAMFRRITRITDMNAILANLLAAIYPTGYPHIQRCINSYRDKCNYGFKNADGSKVEAANATLDFKRTLEVDRKYLNGEIFSRMYAPSGALTEKDVIEFQDKNLKRIVIGPFAVNNGDIRLTVCAPTVERYRNHTRAWISTVESRINEILVDDTGLTEEQQRTNRMGLLNDSASVFRLRRYTSWIESASFTSNEEEDVEPYIIKNDAGINEILDHLFVSGYVDEFEEQIIEAIRKCNMIVTGFVNWECPECKSGQLEDGAEGNIIIPIRLLDYFFILGVLAQRKRT